MTDDCAVPPERYFGAVTMKGNRCSAHGCAGAPVAAFPWRTREEPTPSVVWLCAEHTNAVLAEAGGNDGSMAAIQRTCGQEVDGVPCGALATHLAIVGVPAEPLLRLASVCERHVGAL